MTTKKISFNHEFLIGCEIEGFIHRGDFIKLKRFCKNHNLDCGYDSSLSLSKYRVYNDDLKPVVYETIINHDEIIYLNGVELRGQGFIFDSNNIDKFFKLIKSILKYRWVFNSSCGLHFHISFNNKTYYYKIFNYEFIKKFQDAIIKDLFKTDYEKTRINGFYSYFFQNQEDFLYRTNNQIESLSKDSSRYASINFNSYNIHNTIEFRLFPGTANINQFKKYVLFLCNFIDQELNNKIEIKTEVTTKQHYKPNHKRIKYILEVNN